MRLFLPSVLLLSIVPTPAAGQVPADTIADRLRTRLVASEDPDARRAADNPLFASVALPMFCTARDFRPAWTADGLLLGGTQGEFVGGIGRYGRNASHGPFVHIDVRGSRARW